MVTNSAKLCDQGKVNFLGINLTSSSVLFSRSVVSESFGLHELQHSRPSCRSPTPGVHSNSCPSCPSSWWCHPAISSSVGPFLLPPISPSIRVFSNESTLGMRWPKYWSFSFSISPSNEHAGLISFRMDWLDLFAVQGTLMSLLQHHSSKASILQRAAFFTVQLSHPYMTTGKTIALTRWTLVGRVMSLLFNMLSRLVITFVPISKRLLISWLRSPSAAYIPLNPCHSLLSTPCGCWGSSCHLGKIFRAGINFKALYNSFYSVVCFTLIVTTHGEIYPWT